MPNKNIEETDDDDYEERIADPIVGSIGQLGRWQLRICILLFMVRLPVGWHQFALVFLAAPTVPAQCSEPIRIDKCSSDCHKISYNHSVFDETIITEFDLICDYKFLPKASQSIFGFGTIIGNGLFGILSDRHGRKPILQVCVLIMLIFGVFASFIPWFWSFCVMRFLIGLGVSGSSLISYVMILELVGPEKRGLMSILQYIPINIAHLSLSGFSYFLRNWRNYQFAISITSIIFITYYWLIPESPRWLISNSQFDKAAIILEKGARANNMPTHHIRDDIIGSRKIRPSYINVDHALVNPTILDLFRFHYLRIKTICMCFNCFVCGLSINGISQYIGGMSGNIFVNVAIAGFIGIPGTLVAIPMTKYCGRKKTLIIANTLAGMNMIIITFIPHTSHLLIIILATMCYFWISVTIPNVFLYWGELLPTVLRNTGIGFGSSCQRIGAMLASLVSLTGFISYWLPPAIMGTAILIGAILGFLLPETIGHILPESISESENIYVKIFCL